MTKQSEHTVLQHIPLRNSVNELQKRLAELYDLAVKYNFKDTATAISMAEDTLRKERESNDKEYKKLKKDLTNWFESNE